MTALATFVSPEEDLDILLAGLGLDSVIEEVAHDEIIVGETDLEAAVKGIESQEVLESIYDTEPLVVVAAPVDPMQDPSTLVSGDPVAVEDPAIAKAAKKAEKAAAQLAAREKKAAEKAATAAAKPPVVRKHYANKTERVSDKLGADLGDYLVLEVGDAALTGEALKAKQQETLDAMKGAGSKVQNRMTFLMEYAAGKAAKLNNVATQALAVLMKDGKITTGESGNLLAALSTEYKKSSANTMGGNTILALTKLKMIVQGEKGEYVANPNSLYLMKINGQLGLA